MEIDSPAWGHKFDYWITQQPRRWGGSGKPGINHSWMNQFYQQSLLGLFIVEDIKKRATSTPSDVNELLKSIVLVTSAKATLFNSPSPPTHPNTVCVLLKYYACKIEHLRCGKSFNLFLSHLHTFFPLFIFQVSSITDQCFPTGH